MEFGFLGRELGLKRPPGKSGGRTNTKRKRASGHEPRRRLERRRDGAPNQSRTELLQDRVFESLGCAKANHGLGLDLDRFACSRVAAHARLAVRLDGAAQAGDDEFSCAFGFFHSELEKFIEE